MARRESFWDRRRAGVLAEQDTAVAAVETATAPPETRSDEDILSELGLPDPETLVRGDDFSAFMAKAVPAHLRSRALRTLWRSNPVLACLDGLNDYDADYLTGSTGNGVIATSYRVGKGFLAHLDAVAELSADGAEKPALVGDVPEDAEVPIRPQPTTLSTTASSAEPPHAPGHEAGAEPTPARGVERADPAPRRMRFHFDGRGLA